MLVEHNVLHHHQKCLHAQSLIINSNIKASGAILDYDKTHTQSTTQTGCHGNAGDIIMTPLPADIELRCVVSPPREHPWILYHPLYKTETYIYTHTSAPSFCRNWYMLAMPVSSSWARSKCLKSTSGCLAKIHLGLLSWRHFLEESRV